MKNYGIRQIAAEKSINAVDAQSFTALKHLLNFREYEKNQHLDTAKSSPFSVGIEPYVC
jgi:hypothetical protein